MNNIFKPRRHPAENKSEDKDSDISFSHTDDLSSQDASMQGDEHIFQERNAHMNAQANAHGEAWMRNLASRRKQKNKEPSDSELKASSAGFHGHPPQEKEDFSAHDFSGDFSGDAAHNMASDVKQNSDFMGGKSKKTQGKNQNKVQKPTLSIGRDRGAYPAAKESKPYWLWLLVGSLSILVFSVIALRFWGRDTVEIAGLDKPIITMDNVEWKVRPSDPGGAEIPFEDLEIMDTTGNARLLQNQVDLLLPAAEADQPSPYAPSEPEEALEDQVAHLLEAAGQSEDALNMSENTEDVSSRQNLGSQGVKIAKIVDVPSDIPLIDGSISAWQVQLSTVFSEKDARAEWQRFARRYGNLIAEQPVLISRNGESYALRVGDFDSSQKANNLCERIKTAGGDCLLFSPR